MSEIVRTDQDYIDWLSELKKKYRAGQIKASMMANREMLMFYWETGKGIVQLEAVKKWGTAFYKTLSADLMRILPGVEGLSEKNLYYMKRYYLLTCELMNFPQAVGKLRNED